MGSSLIAQLLLTLLFITEAQIVDKACTINGKFDVRAVNCANAYPDLACQALYGETPTIGSSTDRNKACYTSQTGKIDQDLKGLASEICARQCGYCCASPAYSCANAARPRINCDQVTHRMCRNPTWTDILAEDCPNVCGFCERGCVDLIPDCSLDKTICKRKGLESFVQINCRRTCGYCTNSTSNMSSGEVIGDMSCIFYPPDNYPRCDSWLKNGFCVNAFFPLEFRRRMCATTCKIC